MKSKIKLTGDIIGLDLGMSRTGVARLNTIARISEALQPINMKTSDFLSEVKAIVERYSACAVIVGLPRGLDGQATQQTQWAEKLTTELKNGLKVDVYSIDEAGTTRQAEEIAHTNESVDSVAAGILLEDFVKEVSLGRIENVIF